MFQRREPGQEGFISDLAMRGALGFAAGVPMFHFPFFLFLQNLNLSGWNLLSLGLLALPLCATGYITSRSLGLSWKRAIGLAVSLLLANSVLFMLTGTPQSPIRGSGDVLTLLAVTFSVIFAVLGVLVSFITGMGLRAVIPNIVGFALSGALGGALSAPTFYSSVTPLAELVWSFTGQLACFAFSGAVAGATLGWVRGAAPKTNTARTNPSCLPALIGVGIVFGLAFWGQLWIVAFAFYVLQEVVTTFPLQAAFLVNVLLVFTIFGPLWYLRNKGNPWMAEHAKNGQQGIGELPSIIQELDESEEIECPSCGHTIGPGKTMCPECGWTYMS